MTINQYLKQATKDLGAAGIATARLDARVLICDELNTNSAQLLSEPERILSSEQQQRLDRLIGRRKQHEPLAYIRGKCEFYGREFTISEDVLVPRPETETMIELAKKLQPKVVVDVGTGSGAIAITLACELHEVQVIATDIDPGCLKVARKNCIKHKATVDLKEANLIDGLAIPSGATIVANLPYVPNKHIINQAARHEPKLAIFGGEDGLDLYRTLFAQLSDHTGHVLTEALPTQHATLLGIAKEHGYHVEVTDDFIQVFSSVEPLPR